MESKKNILVAGCSYTAGSGFLNENVEKFTWPYIVGRHYGCGVKNIAIGGMSNEEIYFRTLEQLTYQNKIDLVIVMWSNSGRHWVYPSNKNIDDFTILNKPVPQGTQSSERYTKRYAELHHKYFNNHYVNTKKFLLMINFLGKTLESLSIPYVFVNAFDHEFGCLRNIKYSNGWNTLTDRYKDMLDFDGRPDDFVELKINELQHILNQINTSKFIDLDNFSFRSKCTVDLADDAAHPGPESNQLMSQQIIDHIDNFINKD